MLEDPSRRPVAYRRLGEGRYEQDRQARSGTPRSPGDLQSADTWQTHIDYRDIDAVSQLPKGFAGGARRHNGKSGLLEHTRHHESDVRLIIDHEDGEAIIDHWRAVWDVLQHTRWIGYT